jgi:AcrR family transcriptional regulator
MTSLDAGPPDSGPVGPGRRSDARRNHDRVMAAALQVFAERGLQATVPQVAERAGVGRATVYRSFPSKDDLIAAVAVHQFQKLELRTAAARKGTDPYQAFSDYVIELFEWLAGDRILADALAEATLVSSARILELMTRLMEDAKSSERIRDDATILDLRILLCGAILQLMALGERDPALWRRYAHLVLQALRP